jgi:hypothetical protein
MKRITYPPDLPYELFGQWDWYRDASAVIRHKGVAHYDRERMRGKLQAIIHGAEFDGYHCPPAFITLPESWGPWEVVGAGHFHNAPMLVQPELAGGARVTADYTLRNSGRDSFPWLLEFSDGARFEFRTLAIAEVAITELLKRRKKKHPKLDALSKRTASQIFFTAKRQRELPEDAYANQQVPCEQATAA